MWNLEFFIKLVSVTIGAMCFSMLFGVRPRHLPVATVGAAFTFVIYSLIEFFGMSLFSAAFISTVIAAVYAEICARWRRAPAIVFLVPCLLPTIPGGSLYRTMSNLLARNYSVGLEYLMITLKVSIGIAGGIVTVSLIVKVITSFVDSIRGKRTVDHDEERTEI